MVENIGYQKEIVKLGFGIILAYKLFEKKETDKSDSVKFSLDFPKKVDELLTEFFFLIKSQQSNYNDIKEFPVEPDFNKEIDFGIFNLHSSLKYGIMGACAVSSD